MPSAKGKKSIQPGYSKGRNVHTSSSERRIGTAEACRREIIHLERTPEMSDRIQRRATKTLDDIDLGTVLGQLSDTLDSRVYSHGVGRIIGCVSESLGSIIGCCVVGVFRGKVIGGLDLEAFFEMCDVSQYRIAYCDHRAIETVSDLCGVPYPSFVQKVFHEGPPVVVSHIYVDVLAAPTFAFKVTERDGTGHDGAMFGDCRHKIECVGNMLSEQADVANAKF